MKANTPGTTKDEHSYLTPALRILGRVSAAMAFDCLTDSNAQRCAVCDRFGFRRPLECFRIELSPQENLYDAKNDHPRGYGSEVDRSLDP
jgi:hypothetical protein